MLGCQRYASLAGDNYVISSAGHSGDLLGVCGILRVHSGAPSSLCSMSPGELCPYLDLVK